MCIRDRNNSEMDDNARGMASKILCDLLNISKGDSASANCENGNIAYKFLVFTVS